MPRLNPARPETAIEDQTASHAEAASSGFSTRCRPGRRLEVSIRPSKIRTRNRRDRERRRRGVVTVDVSSTPYKTPFLGKEVPDDHQPDHAAKRRISILRPHDGGDGADRRPAWEVAEESGGGETAPDSPELIERRPTHREVACDGPDTGGCRDHSCGTLDSNQRKRPGRLRWSFGSGGLLHHRHGTRVGRSPARAIPIFVEKKNPAAAKGACGVRVLQGRDASRP